MTQKGQTTKKKYLGMEKNKAIIIVMAVIMLLSSAGWITSSLVEEDESEAQISQAAVTIDFGNYTRVDKILTIGAGESALDLFNKVGTVTVDFKNNAFVITKIEAGNNTAYAEGNQTWVFYVNGIMKLDDPDTYIPKQGDMMELRIEENPY